jgi:hypothetical protein
MLGYVKASDEETALAVAVEAFDILQADRRRIVVQRTSDQA